MLTLKTSTSANCIFVVFLAKIARGTRRGGNHRRYIILILNVVVVITEIALSIFLQLLLTFSNKLAGFHAPLSLSLSHTFSLARSL